MSHTAHLTASASLLRLHTPESECLWLTARFSSKEFGESVKGAIATLTPSYFRTWEPHLEKVAWLSRASDRTRPLMSGHSPLAAEFLCFAVESWGSSEELLEKLRLHGILDVAVAHPLGDSPLLDELRAAGLKVTLAEVDSLAGDLAALITAHYRRDLREMLPTCAVEQAPPLAELRSYLESAGRSLYCDWEDTCAVDVETTQEHWHSRWGAVLWRGPRFVRLSQQLTSVVGFRSSTEVVVDSREVGFWPGPVRLGRSVQLTAWDLLRSREMIASHESMGTETAASEGRVASMVNAMSRELSVEACAKRIHQQMVGEASAVLAAWQVPAENRHGPMRGGWQ